jgi:hypothetical protein
MSMATNDQTMLVPVESIAQSILVLRGQKVIIDTDLATLYGATTKRFNEQVRRNLERFPADFMFQLNEAEWESLRSQFATLKAGRGQHRKYLPYAFTEHGAIMAATILNSPRATEVSVYVVRAFVALREMLAGNKELAAKFNELAHKVDSHDQAIAGFINAMRELMRPPEPAKKHPIGFVTEKGK